MRSGMEAEPMGFKEAIAYGVRGYIGFAHKTRHTKDMYREAGLGTPDWIIPSAMAPPPEITPQLTQAAESLAHQIRKNEGKPFNPAVIENQIKEVEKRRSFHASGWSKLFPRIKDTGRVIKLDI
jgi:hypothetical protein